MGYGQYSIYGHEKRRSNPLKSEPKPKRQVYPSSEIAHLWMHQTQTNARNPQGNFYFIGPVIYSYRQSAPLARIVEHRGKKAVLFNTARWSVTTSGQQSAVRHAIPSNVPVFEVPNIGEPSVEVHKANLAYFVRKSKSELDKAMRARSSAGWLLESALDYQTKALTYAEFFGVKSKVPSFKFLPVGEKLETLRTEFAERKRKSDEITIRARATRRANREREWNERREIWERNREIQERQDRLTLPDRIAKWRAGERVYGSLSRVPCMLRITGDTVETSWGAVVPIDHARRVLKLVRACRSTGRTYQRNGHTVHVGHYSVDSIDGQGTLTAGCHVIEWEEIARIQDDLDGRVDQTEVILGETTGETV